jgi:acetate kinase
VCSGLQFLGIDFDQARNSANNQVISTDASRVAVRVIRTDEELMIAREVSRFLAREDLKEPR